MLDLCLFSHLHGHHNYFPRVVIFSLVIMYGLQKWELLYHLNVCVDEVYARCAHATLWPSMRP